MRVCLLAGLGLALSACATAPTDIGLDTAQPAALTDETKSEEGDAILIFAVGPIATGGGYQFQKIKEDQSGFAEDTVMLGFGAWGIGDKMKRPKGDESSIWVLENEINFLIKRVPSGTYAANYVTWNIANGYSTGSAWLCQDDGAPVYELASGEINILSSRDAFPKGVVSRISANYTEDDLLEQFKLTRENYPNLKGDPVIVYPTQQARWTEKTGFFTPDCQIAEPDTFSIHNIRAAGTSGELDDADKAAIAAALANLKTSEIKTDETPNETE